MQNVCLINGKKPGKKELLDFIGQREFLMGRNAFTSLLCLKGNLIFWELHLERLRKSFEFLYEEHSFKDFEKKITSSLSQIDKSKDFSIRLTMVSDVKEVNLLTQINSIPVSDDNHKSLKTSMHPNRLSELPNFLKSGNYLHTMEKVNEAKKKGFDDCLFLDNEESAAECSVSNIFFRKGNRFFTPELKGPILDGVTRKILLEVMKDIGYAVEEIKMQRAEWESMDEVFMTNSLKGIMQVSKIDMRGFETSSEFMLKIIKEYNKKMSLI